MGSERMVEVVRRYGSERMIVDSSADWGVSDPLAVPRTAALMLERGISREDVERVTWSNALDAYAQSGQIDLRGPASDAPAVDQTRLYRDNSVLRGQAPRIDEPVPKLSGGAPAPPRSTSGMAREAGATKAGVGSRKPERGRRELRSMSQS